MNLIIFSISVLLVAILAENDIDHRSFVIKIPPEVDNATVEMWKNSLNTSKYLVKTSDKERLQLYSRKNGTFEENIQDLRNEVQTKIAPNFSGVTVLGSFLCEKRVINANFILPVTRIQHEVAINDSTVKCTGNPYRGAHWFEPDIDVILNPLTTYEDVKQFAANLTSNTAIDADAIRALATKLNQVTHKSTEILNQLQEKNETNIILAQIDSILLQAQNVENVSEKALDNVAIRVENITKTGGSGIALMGFAEKDGTGKEKNMHLLRHNDTIETLWHLNIIAAIKLPNSTLKGKHRVAYTSFKKGSIFKVNSLSSAVIGVFIEGESNKKFDEPVRLYFRRSQFVSPNPEKCVYWDFQANSNYGNWSDEGCKLHKVHTKKFQESANKTKIKKTCQDREIIDTHDIVIDEFFCYHLTHFGEFIVDHDDNESKCNPPESPDPVLDFVSLWGSVASLAFIFIYIVIVVSIRSELLQRPGQKTKLQLTINFAILLILFIVGTKIRNLTQTEKAVLGVCTHYFILCNFAWMLNAAILQYRRLVIVFTNKSTKIRVALSLAAYIFPVFPPLLAYSAGGNEVYSQPPFYLPRGLVFYLTIVLPLLVTMFFNVVVFIRILVNLYSKPEVRMHGGKCHNESYIRLKQLVFLFFLFGLAWMFALGQLVVKEALLHVFSYLFVFSISMQGFVYFVTFVVMDKDVRKIWVERYKVAK